MQCHLLLLLIKYPALKCVLGDKIVSLKKLREIIKVFLLQDSDTGATPYFVAVKKNGVCFCQCKGFKTASLCSHLLAVADHVAKLHESLSL